MSVLWAFHQSVSHKIEKLSIKTLHVCEAENDY